MQKTLGKEILFWTAIIGGICLVVAGMIYLVSLQRVPTADGTVTIENVITADDWVLGDRNAKVILTEYSDLQCPACASYHPVVKQIVEDFEADIAFVYRHFPLPSHPHAREMAYATEAAGKQGKFWEMHDLIFETQSEWTSQNSVDETVAEFAGIIGLDAAKFKTDFESGEIRSKIDTAVAHGREVGISYTPTFFLNGVRIQNPNSYTAFADLLNEAIAAAKEPATETASTTPNATNATE
jgi:protein-disulfide isomerase